MEKSLNDLDAVIDYNKGYATVENTVTASIARMWLVMNMKPLEKVTGKYRVRRSKFISNEQRHYFELIPESIVAITENCIHEADEEGFCINCGVILG